MVVTFRCIYPAFWAGEETGRQVTYLAGVVHGSGFSNVSRKSNRLFASMICHMGLAMAWMDLLCAKPDCTEP